MYKEIIKMKNSFIDEVIKHSTIHNINSGHIFKLEVRNLKFE